MIDEGFEEIVDGGFKGYNKKNNKWFSTRNIKKYAILMEY